MAFGSGPIVGREIKNELNLAMCELRIMQYCDEIVRIISMWLHEAFVWDAVIKWLEPFKESEHACVKYACRMYTYVGVYIYIEFH